MASQVAKAARLVKSELHGVVVSSGLMDKTVKVRVGGQKWNKIIHKHFSDPRHHLVHDPNSSLRTGDVVAIAPGWRSSRHKRHYVKQIIAASGIPVSERPPIPTLEEMIAEHEAAKAVKDDRRAARKEVEAEKRAEEKRIKKERNLQKRNGSREPPTEQEAAPATIE